MNRIAKIVLSSNEIDNLAQALFNAGRIVGRREVRRANVFVSLSRSNEPEHVFTTTFDNTVPGPWALLVGSVRWSISRGEYVVSKNDFLDEDMFTFVEGHLNEGLASGIKDLEEAIAAKEAIEALEENIIFRFHSQYGASAYFQERGDAEAWAMAKAGDNHPWSAIWASLETDPFVHAIVGKIKEDGGPALDGLWYVFVSNKTVAEVAL